MNEDLKKLKEEILEYMKKEGFNVFYGKEAPTAKPSTEIRWFSEEGDWKDFLKTAKLEGIKTMIVNYSILTKDDIEINLQIGETEKTKSADEFSKELKSFQDHIGKIGELNLMWIKDGIRYTYTEATDWWLDFQSLVAPKLVTREFIPEEEEVISAPYGVTSVQIPEDLKSKTAEELAEEMIEFIKKEFPDVDEHVSFHELTRLFWVKKGLRYGYIEDPELTIKMQKAEYLGKQKIQTSETPTEILEKSEEELAKEFMDYIEKEFPDSRSPARYIMDVFLPDGPCLACMGIITPERLQRESEESGYVSGQQVPNPSVISLNGVVASLAVTEFLDLLTGFERRKDPLTYQVYDILKGVVWREKLAPTTSCSLCREVKALGDNIALPCTRNQVVKRR
jgi:hypothetical protein